LGEFEYLRAYFSPCGIGLGHVGRCYPIAKELLREGATVLFSTYRDGVDYVKKLDLPLVKSPSIGFSVDLAGRVDFKRTSTQTFTAIPKFLIQVNAEIENIKTFKPDIVISDSRLSSIVAAKFLDIPTIVILNQFNSIIPRRKRFFNASRIADGGVLTLVGQGWGLSDLILVPDFPPPYTISLRNLRIPKRFESSVKFIGTILTKKPSEVNGWRKIRSELGLKKNEYLIFAPISGPREERLPLIAKLMRLFEELPEKYHVVMSLGEVNGDSTPIRRGHLTVLPWITNRFDYLKACDLVISKAGHGTIMEAISFEKPQILIPTLGHTEQYGNARRTRELGIAEAIDQEELIGEKLFMTIEKMLINQIYSVNLKKIREENSLDGVKNVVTEVKKLLGRSSS
jgi:UDP:flavonoid glycosyltransferase YjiC (YdhE family)